MSSSTLKILGLFLAFIVIISLTTFGVFKTGSSVAGGGLNKEEVNELIKQYIQDNPEAILSSLTSYQQQANKRNEEDSLKKVQDRIGEIENNKNDPVVGNKDGDIAVVQFFDYSCGYCKKVAPHITQLIDEDKNVRVVFKEFPILGPNSEIASRAAIAVNMIAPEKYFDFHNNLMKARITGEDMVIKMAGELGIKADDLKKQMLSPDVTMVIEANRKLAREIGIGGTPAFIIGGEFVPGAIEYKAMQDIIAQVRASN